MLKTISIILLIIVGINAVAGGYSFITDPTGSSLGISTQILTQSPFHDFLVPGIILFIANGVFSLLTAMASLAKLRFYSYAVILQGSILLGWIVIQLVMLRFFHVLHLIFGITGLLLIISGMVLSKSREDVVKQ
jgi:hypothetical protein